MWRKITNIRYAAYNRTEHILSFLNYTPPVLYPYTAERRDVLENTLPEAQEIFQGPRGAKSPPEGNLEGLGGCISQYIPPLGSVRIQYFPSEMFLCLT